MLAQITMTTTIGGNGIHLEHQMGTTRLLSASHPVLPAIPILQIGRSKAIHSFIQGKVGRHLMEC